MDKHEWKDEAKCLGMDTNVFFDKYEERESLRPAVEKLCSGCPVRKQCFAVGVSQKEWGVWGGVYIENGQISREFNKHRDKESWSQLWQSLTFDKR